MSMGASSEKLGMKKLTYPAIGMAALLTIAPVSTCAGPSPGCGADGWASGSYTMQQRDLGDSTDITRHFRVHVPRGYKKNVPAPLIVIFHGWGGDEDEFLGNKSVRSLADKRGYILLAPRGLGAGAPDNSNNSWTFSGSATGLDGDGINDDVPGDTDATCGAGTQDYSYASCALAKANNCSWTQCQADDVQFALSLVESAKANLCVDSDHVFATGGSNGGMFTWELGQNPASAGTFRAIAPLIGLPHRGYLDAQGKTGDMPVLVVTGTQDTVVPPGDWEDDSFTTTSNGSDRYYYAGATAITQVWAVAHGCGIDEPAKPFNDGNRKTDCRTYCDVSGSEWPAVLDCRARMGHTYSFSWAWPLILGFFDAHSN
jgi:poly(3-hydroxybutyrate) depolymerase